VTRLFTVLAATLAGATLVGLVLLWPGHVESPLAQGAVVDSDKAEVERVNEVIWLASPSRSARTRPCV
jgi:hypothetical protein